MTKQYIYIRSIKKFKRMATDSERALEDIAPLATTLLAVSVAGFLNKFLPASLRKFF